jgi:hypothetical protein
MEKLFSNPRIEKFEEELAKHTTVYDYDTKEYPIEVIVHKFDPILPDIQAEMFIPDYQREFVWSEAMQSEFIESLFLWMPVQPIFVSTNKDGLLEIIDGSQRIRTINAFIKGELKIQKITKLVHLNGLKFSDLPLARQRKFKLISIRFHNITDKANLEIRKDIFRRINKHEELTASEIRKGSYVGEFYTFIQECAKNPLLEKLCPIAKEMKDRGEYEELLLRFFAYTELGLNQKERGQPLLDNYLLTKNKEGFDRDLKQKDYQAMLSFVNTYFPNGFRKSTTSDTTPRVRFEAIAVGVAYALKEKTDLTPESMKWLLSDEFKKVTTSDSSNNTGRLALRVNFVKDCLLNKKKELLTYNSEDTNGLFPK